MYLSHLHIKNHPILKDLNIDFINPNTGKPYAVVAFVGENGCGKTTLLNEIFKYESSSYVIDKEKEGPLSLAPYVALYLRQNSLAKNAMKETRKLIDGKDIYPICSVSQTFVTLKSSGPLTNVEEGLEILKKLNNDEICNLFKEKHIEEVYCSQDVSKVIDGKNHGYDVSKFSSGQQEILLKLKDLKQFGTATDCVLLDEPETSLHPRWQKEIVNLISLLLTDNNNNVPQIFVATHSEKVLESLFNKNDALIIRLFKENEIVKFENIDQMNLCLPKTTFAELEYVIFKIDTYEYCSQLYDLLEWKYGNAYKVDKMILKSVYYDDKIHYKPWHNDKTDRTEQFTLPTYVRNYFHHPKDREEPTPEELNEAIELLRNIVLNSDKK